jgi:hypothetical protein
MGYTGPRPSPAKPWAPWVIATSAILALGNVFTCVLNVIERHNQEQRLHGADAVVTAHIQHTLTAIRTASTFDLIAASAFVVVGVVWSVKRRPRARLKRDRETAVEPALRTVSPVVYWTFWVTLAASAILAVSATSFSHPGATVQDFITYRTRLAVSAAFRTVMWACWIPLVILSTKLQERREAVADSAQRT